MYPGEHYMTSQVLGIDYSYGKHLYTVHTRMKQDMILVTHDKTNTHWQPVEKINGTLSRDILLDKYGLYPKLLWDGKDINEKSIREKDNLSTFTDIVNNVYLASCQHDRPYGADILAYKDIVIVSATSNTIGNFIMLLGLVICEKVIITRHVITEEDLPPF
ncbi:MAG: hypothetical protein ABRQ38_08815 [Candidatus Eremiobacterota bacterium]